jgi:hypothetical protein
LRCGKYRSGWEIEGVPKEVLTGVRYKSIKPLYDRGIGREKLNTGNHLQKVNKELFREDGAFQYRCLR